jgi:hypothetical protein
MQVEIQFEKGHDHEEDRHFAVGGGLLCVCGEG